MPALNKNLSSGTGAKSVGFLHRWLPVSPSTLEPGVGPVMKNSRAESQDTLRNAPLVVIPVFNRSKMIIEALDGVQSQTLRPSEVIVVDDGSTDATATSVEAWIAQHPQLNVTLIKSPNRGASAARNLGFSKRRTTAEFVAFLDSDDLWPVDFLERTAHRLANNPDAPLAVADRNFVEVNGGKSKFVSSHPFERDPFLQLIRVGAGYGSAALLRVSAYEDSGGHPEDVPTGHDIILFGKLVTMGKCLHVAGAPVTMRTWSLVAKADQEPHLHLRYPDRYIRWAETYLTICEWRLSRPEHNGAHELRYHAAIAYRLLLALGVEVVRMQPTQMLRVLKNLSRLAALASKAFGRIFKSGSRANPI
jgi:glycosyltransferase involved in cell wall biosynthesis